MLQCLEIWLIQQLIACIATCDRICAVVYFTIARILFFLLLMYDDLKRNSQFKSFINSAMKIIREKSFIHIKIVFVSYFRQALLNKE